MSHTTQLSHRPTTAPAYTYHTTATPLRGTLNHTSNRQNHKQTTKLCTLDNIDDTTTHITLNTPRSIECCRRLGIDPNTELVYRHTAHFIDKYTASADAQLISRHIPDYARMRYDHYNTKRKHKLDRLRALRHSLHTHTDTNGNVRVVDSRAAGSGGGQQQQQTTAAETILSMGLNKQSMSDQSSDTVTLLDNEKKNVQRMHQREMAKLKNRVLYELRCATIKSTQEYEMAQQRQRDDAGREAAERQHRQRCEAELQARLKHQRQVEHDGELKRAAAHADWVQQQQVIDERIQQQKQDKKQGILDQQSAARKAAERKAQLDAILQQQHDRVQAKAAELDRREQQRLAALQETREQEAKVAEKANRKKWQRYQTQFENNQRLEQQKRELYEQRAELAEQRRVLLEQQRAEEAAEARHQSELRDAHAQRCRAEAEAVLDAKKRAVLEKHAATRARLEADEATRVKCSKTVDADLAAKERHRRDIYDANQRLMDQRVTDLNQRIDQANQRHGQMVEQRERELAAKKLHDNMVNDDRVEKVAQAERQHQYRRDKLLERVNADTERVQLIKTTLEQLQKQRLKIRDAAFVKTNKVVKEFESIAHAGKWALLRSMDDKENVLLRSGVVTADELMAATSPTNKRVGSRPQTSHQMRSAHAAFITQMH